MVMGWSEVDAFSFWQRRPTDSILRYPVSQQRQDILDERRDARSDAVQLRRHTFITQNRLQDADGQSIVFTPEAEDIQFWARFQSWTFCDGCGKLEPRKMLPAFHCGNPTPLTKSCKCSTAVYKVPVVDDIPLILRNLTEDDLCLLRPLTIHCGDYERRFNGYRQRTGPFHVNWSDQPVHKKIGSLDNPRRRAKLTAILDFLVQKADSSYAKFNSMHLRGYRRPYLYEIYSSRDFVGVECALWPSYPTTAMCESVLEGQTNRASGKISFMHKILLAVPDYSLSYELLQYQYDRWLFKTITGAVNSSKQSGCSPNRSLENKTFSRTFWQHQNLYLIDAVRQYGYPSFFLTISPYEWTFPFPPFIQQLRERYGRDVTEIPSLETLHIAHVLEQVARGYLTGGNCNRRRTHVFGNKEHPTTTNVNCYFYRFEFQKQGTLHLHMLLWLRNIAVTRADLLNATVPWANADDAFVVADTQKSDKSCLKIHTHPTSFITLPSGKNTIELQHTADDNDRHIRAHLTTILGSLRCRSDVQLADGKALLLKYVSSYVTKMHESATSEGLYCNDVTGYQAANSFLRTVTPLEPEMIFELSSTKVCWMDKISVLFRPPFPGQTDSNKVYQHYLQRPRCEDHQALLFWMRTHNTSSTKPKACDGDRYLIGVKFVSVFNPVYFYQHLTMHHPHRSPNELRHPEEESIPKSIQFVSQAVALLPETWQSSHTISQEFEHEGHKEYFVRTIVAYVSSLHDVLYLWRIRVVTGDVSDVSAFSIDRLYPLSSHQRSILADITGALTSHREQQENSTDRQDEQSSSWRLYRVLLGKPGTGKSQVLIRAIHHAVENEMSVLVAAPVALPAQGYHKIFLADIETDTLHGAFNIPVDAPFHDEVNYGLNKYDLVVVDEASMISAPTFHAMATTFNRLNLRPVVVFAGDKHQQQPLQTEAGRVTATTPIINDTYTFHAGNTVKHFLYHQFRIVDEDYGRFLDLIRYTQPTQQQLDSVQENMILCPEGDLSDHDIWRAFMSKDASTVMTVSRRGAQRINNIVVVHLFADQRP